MLVSYLRVRGTRRLQTVPGADGGSSSTLLKKMNVFPYSSHVEQCCQKLGALPFGGHILVMVVAQHLTENIAKTEGQEPIDLAPQVKLIRDKIDFPIHQCRMSPRSREDRSDVVQQLLGCIYYT